VAEQAEFQNGVATCDRCNAIFYAHPH
jgi:hypothetical protein